MAQMSQKQLDKITKLSELYDITNPKDLFTLIPQEMEVAEIKGMSYDWDGDAKRQEVIEVIMAVAVKNNIDFTTETLSAFIDVINAASTGKYALNKGQS